MFGRLFGRKKQNDPEADAAARAADEAFDAAKQSALERTLGPMDEMVYHSIIPFFLGGGLDLYTFSRCIPGVVFATQELITRDPQHRTKPGKDGHFEIVACLPSGKGLADEAAMKLVNSILNPIARYASMAKLSPGETAELPGDEGEPSLPLLLDSFNPKNVPFEFNSERFGLLLCMTITHTELAFARAEGAAKLMARLHAAGAYPYSNLERRAVV